MFRPISVVLWLGGTGIAIAEPVQLTNETIRRDVVGGVLRIDTPLKIAIPVRIGADGLVSGEAGPLAGMLGAAKDRGRWWLDGDQLCFKWFRWFDAKARCISAQREGNRIYWQESTGETGTATLEPPQPSPQVAKTGHEGQNDSTAPIPAPAPDVAEAPPPAPSSDPPPPPRFASAALGAMTFIAPPKPVETSRLGAEVRTAKLKSAPQTPVKKSRPQPAQSVSATSSAPPARLATDDVAEVLFRVAGVPIGDSLNVRSGPSEYHAAVGSISFEGRGIRLTGACYDVWCPIQHGQIAGWVNSYFLEEEGWEAAGEREVGARYR